VGAVKAAESAERREGSLDRLSPPGRYTPILPGRGLGFSFGNGRSRLPSLAPWGAMGEGKVQRPIEHGAEAMGG